MSAARADVLCAVQRVRLIHGLLYTTLNMKRTGDAPMSALPRPDFTDIDQVRKQFRQAMAHLGAAVNVITTTGTHGRCGITASAVCSVTDTPPIMLVCINQSSYVHDVLQGNGRACINVLGAHAQELARVFAGMDGSSTEERFSRCGSRTGA